jgi:hypothetical protein
MGHGGVAGCSFIIRECAGLSTGLGDQAELEKGTKPAPFLLGVDHNPRLPTDGDFCLFLLDQSAGLWSSASKDGSALVDYE